MPFLAAARRRGFTLVELLIALTILAIVSGSLLPVFAAVRRSAQATSCLGHFAQATKAVLLYTGDYDDRLVPVNHRPGLPPDPATDRVWPQILLPYVRDFRVFECPAAPRSMGFGGPFDPDLVPGDYAARYYDAALHVDLGYNAYYLAPIVREADGWVARPKATTEAERPARTLLFVESGGPGGGSYLVSPPCRYAAAPQGVADTFVANAVSADANLTSLPEALFTPLAGWDLRGGRRLPAPRRRRGTPQRSPQRLPAGRERPRGDRSRAGGGLRRPRSLAGADHGERAVRLVPFGVTAPLRATEP